MHNNKLGHVWLVSRHRAAIECLQQQAYAAHKQVAHLNVWQVQAGDQVIATLPIHMAAQVCANGARYYHLTITLPAELRGQE